MTDKKFDQLSEQEFDLYLEEIIDSPPPADLSDDFKPWRKAMNRILWGSMRHSRHVPCPAHPCCSLLLRLQHLRATHPVRLAMGTEQAPTPSPQRDIEALQVST